MMGKQVFIIVFTAAILNGCNRKEEAPAPSLPSTESIVDFNKREVEFLKKELQTSRIQQQKIKSFEKELKILRQEISNLHFQLQALRSGGVEAFSVTVLGHVNRPGTYISTEPVTVLEAFGFAGGVQEDADVQRVVIKEGDQSSEEDLEDLLYYGKGHDIELPDGIVFIVPPFEDTDY